MARITNITAALKEAQAEEKELKSSLTSLAIQQHQLKVDQESIPDPVRQFLGHTFDFTAEKALVNSILKVSDDLSTTIKDLIERWKQISGNLLLLQGPGRDYAFKLLKGFYNQLLMVKDKHQKILQEMEKKPALLAGTYASFLRLEEELKPVGEWLRKRGTTKEGLLFLEKMERSKKDLEIYIGGLADICHSLGQKIDLSLKGKY